MDHYTNNAEALRIMRNIATARYDYVRFTFIDFHGITRSKTVPKARVKQFFQDGCSFFAGAIGFSLVGPMVPRHVPDIQNTNSGNVFARPQPGTLHSLPLNGGPLKVGEVICETYFPNGCLQEGNPRTLARKQLDRLKALGHELLSSWELEVVFLDKSNMKPNFNRSIHAFSNLAFDDVEELLLHADRTFSEMGIDLETLQTEACPGQYEFVMKPSRGLRQADNLIIMKDALRKLANKYHKKAVFMSKVHPEPGYSTALHFNISMNDIHTRNAFSNMSDPHKLSKVCRNFLSGILKHAPALTAFCCPTVNCYRRLHCGIAPSKADWGLDARLAYCRVKNYNVESTYIECRLPSGSANPYLVMAATVAAGIDGLFCRDPLPLPIGNDHLPPTMNDAASTVTNKAHGDENTTTDGKPASVTTETDSQQNGEKSETGEPDVVAMETVDGPQQKKVRLEEGAKESADVTEPLVMSTESDSTVEGSGGAVEAHNPEHQTTNCLNTAQKRKHSDSQSSTSSDTASSANSRAPAVSAVIPADIPRTLEEALQALEADTYMVNTLGKDFVKWFAEIKRNEIAHFKSFEGLSDEELLVKECECYIDLL